ncbi:MAG TPA: efflux RND transporter periplasmic adaptor subunit [Planctomycetota bacterium]
MIDRPHPFLSACLLPLVVLACAPACAPSSAALEDDHAHDDELEPTSQTVFGARLLTYVEHPPLVRGETAEFLVHLTVLATGEPVRAGRVVLELGAGRLAADAPLRDGLFVPQGSLAEAGTFPARLVVESGADSETLALAPVVVHADAHAAAHAAEEAPAGPAGAIPFLLEQQWQVQLLLAEAGPRALTERLVVPGAVVTPEGAEAAVVAPLTGRLVPPEGGHLPVGGARVERGALLGWIEPPLDGPARFLALELAATRLEIERSASAAAAGLEFATKDRARLDGLARQGLATQQELEAAERELAAAQGAARAAEEALDALGRLGRVHEDDGSLLRLALLAPLAGEVVSAPFASGALVPAGAEAFHLLDPDVLWIEGRVDEFDLAHLAPAPAARATFPALPGLALELDAPLWVAPRLEPGSRTVRLRYAAASVERRLRAGMLAELALAVRSAEAAVAIPRTALVQDGGLDTAYVMLAGESFERRVLALGISDGEWVEVRSGLSPGERVAARAAHLVKLAALAPAGLGHGHHH